MNVTQRSLLQAVHDSPCDDTPRLIYADYLEEYGDHAGVLQASLIRLQLELEALAVPRRLPPGEGLTFRQRSEEERRKRALRRQLQAAQAGLKRQGFPARVNWRRGFIAGVSWRQADFLKHAGRLFALHPVGSVGLRDRCPVRLGPGRAYCWCNIQLAEAAGVLPEELCDCLSPDNRVTAFRWQYDSRALAVEDLRQALLRYGRARAEYFWSQVKS